MNATTLLMRCITHLHAGSDDAGIGIIDKLIQRDPTTGLPCVHASSLKGAIKQFAAGQVGDKKLDLQLLFGSDTSHNMRASAGERTMQQGGLAFLPARLLAYPAQGEKQPYFLVTCPALLFEWANEMKLLSNSNDDLVKSVWQVARQVGRMHDLVSGDTGRNGGMSIVECTEESREHFNKIGTMFREGFAVISDEEFIEMTDDFNLPVVARNSLDDGQSRNLWYEQLIPRRSIFWTSLLPITIDTATLKLLINALVANDPVQIGANASVGMGFVKFLQL